MSVRHAVKKSTRWQAYSATPTSHLITIYLSYRCQTAADRPTRLGGCYGHQRLTDSEAKWFSIGILLGESGSVSASSSYCLLTKLCPRFSDKDSWLTNSLDLISFKLARVLYELSRQPCLRNSASWIPSLRTLLRWRWRCKQPGIIYLMK